MRKPVDNARIAKFHQDRELLLYNDINVAKGMAMDRSNYSSYINGRKTITHSFLHKFYKAFGEELSKLSGLPTELDVLKSMDNKLAAILEALNRLV